VGVAKLDLLLDGPLPWTAAACAEAGTVHLGGPVATIAAAERATARGGTPALPYVIVAQPSLADPSRAPAGQHVVWAYRHVPNGSASPSDVDGIDHQLDRFAPGWRDLVVHRRAATAVDYAAYNRSFVGGDVAGGAMTPWQIVARPRLALDPYRTRVPGVWLCSQATPPGPGVHGMCGWHAAGSVLAAG
jgi:phytoene dehydrogenase-like protein